MECKGFLLPYQKYTLRISKVKPDSKISSLRKNLTKEEQRILSLSSVPLFLDCGSRFSVVLVVVLELVPLSPFRLGAEFLGVIGGIESPLGAYNTLAGLEVLFAVGGRKLVESNLRHFVFSCAISIGTVFTMSSLDGDFFVGKDDFGVAGKPRCIRN